jgi:hypothetical protein
MYCNILIFINFLFFKLWVKGGLGKKCGLASQKLVHFLAHLKYLSIKQLLNIGYNAALACFFIYSSNYANL